MLFSERIGKTPKKDIIQYESMDEDLRNSLWSIFYMVYVDNVKFDQRHYGDPKNCSMSKMINKFWLELFKEPIDTVPYKFLDTIKKLREYYFSANWLNVYNFIQLASDFGSDNLRSTFQKGCNKFLEKENSAYRFVSNEIVNITNKDEIESIENAASYTNKYSIVSEHIKTALSLMNDRDAPDYRNSIKESISAVESAAKIITDDERATFGQALKVLEKNGNLHEALKKGYSSLYGYTNDADGIRHALMEKQNLNKSDAKYMLVSCSAFVNYLIENVQ